MYIKKDAFCYLRFYNHGEEKFYYNLRETFYNVIQLNNYSIKVLFNCYDMKRKLDTENVMSREILTHS